MKGIKGDLNKWRDISCRWVGKLNIIKRAVPPKLIYKFNVIPTNISASYFTNIDKLILNFKWKGK